MGVAEAVGVLVTVGVMVAVGVSVAVAVGVAVSVGVGVGLDMNDNAGPLDPVSQRISTTMPTAIRMIAAAPIRNGVVLWRRLRYDSITS